MQNETTPEKISAEMTIEEIFSSFPQKSQLLAQEMTSYGLHCVGCHAATWETLEAGMLGHGFSLQDVEALLSRLNRILEEKTDETTISLTERAAKKYLDILQSEGKEGWGLRFAEKPSGCNGFEYLLDFSKEPSEEDLTIVDKGVEIHIQKNSFDRLKGSQIDFVEALQGAGFKVSNPNVRSSCSCGSSHGY